MMPLSPQLHRAVLLATILMLLLRVKGVRPQKGGPDPTKSSQKETLPSTDQGEEQFEERFVASSMGEMWQLLDMAQQEDEMAGTVVARVHLFSLAFCVNLASIMVFL
ncbi:sperm-egg fusion protein LLCFC1 [Orycteropus afer afer]|uniref:Sperm-egg fusion protein LLCFC1 n=1 Tax=Orycteropus afer afer TaxID=1230840 RepID=A0A8B7B7R0_ORYAF|nr:sperm-egg fusion protein LLCFC1 [Orycteropus afer afer]